MSVFSYGSRKVHKEKSHHAIPKTGSGDDEKRHRNRRDAVSWQEVIDTYKRQKGWENVKTDREALTPKGKRQF